MNTTSPVYADFGQRFAAMLIDNLLFAFVLAPVAMLFFEQPNYSQAEIEQILQTQGPLGLINHQQLFLQQLIILCITVFFWVRFAGTPGKRIMKIMVVDASTLKPLSVMQSIVRYLGYFISMMPMGMGFLWMLMDDKNQAWHDKFSHAIVIKIPDNSSLSQLRTTTNKQPPHPQDDDVFTA